MAKKKSEVKDATFDHIVAKSITVKSDEGGPTVTMMASNHAAGVWVDNGKLGNVAMVAQANMPPYFIVWGKDNKYPPLAISTDADGKLSIQVVDTKDCTHPGDHWMQHIKWIDGEELVKLDAKPKAE